MNHPRVTLLASHEKVLNQHFQSHVNERAAIVLFRKISSAISDLPNSDRFLSVEVHPFEEAWITSSSPSHIAFETRPLREFFRRCEDESLVFAFVHNHPAGYPNFSQVDDENELTLLKALSNRNGNDASLVALLWTKSEWKARIRFAADPVVTIDARHVLVADRPLRIYTHSADTVDLETHARQAAAFGAPFVRMLGSLRVGVVGTGGTGSPTTTLLARAGVGELVLIDPDKLEKTNLNRVRGSRYADVGTEKATVLANFVGNLGLSVRVTSISTHVDTPTGIDALASCDVVFGCTDDQIGREVQNMCAYAYSQAYIDVGLGGQISQNEYGQPYLRYHHGRVSTILPEEGECLFCQGVLTEQWIRRDYALRANPQMTEGEARERYLEGGAEQAPGVGPFTSAVADYGVATLFDLLMSFRKFPGELRWDAFSIDFVRMCFSSTQERGNKECPYCGTREFLVMKEKYRLNRPALGIRNGSH